MVWAWCGPGDQEKSLSVEGEGSQLTMTSAPGRSLTPQVSILNGRRSALVGFFFFYFLARMQVDLNVRSVTYICFQP
jgi:hypothetical protein